MKSNYLLLLFFITFSKSELQCSTEKIVKQKLIDFLNYKNWNEVEQNQSWVTKEKEKKILIGVISDKVTLFQINKVTESELLIHEKIIQFLDKNKNNNQIEIPKIIDCVKDNNELTIFVKGILT